MKDAVSVGEALELGERLRGESGEALRDGVRRLEEGIVSCEGRLRRVGYEQLMLVYAYWRSEGWRKRGCRSAGAWIARELGIARKTADTRVRVARALQELPAIRGRFAAGRLSYTQVRQLVRKATAENEGALLDRLDVIGADRMAEELSIDDTGEGEPEAVRSKRLRNGMMRVTVILAPDRHAILMRAIEAALEQGWRAPVAVEVAPEGAGLAPEGAGLAPEGAGLAPEGAGSGPGRADALVSVARAFLAGGQGSGAGRAEVVVCADWDVLRGVAEDGQCELLGGRQIGVDTALRVSCDAGVVAMQEANGWPEKAGKRVRTISESTRRRLLKRDGGQCRFPGCDATVFLQGHHLVHWARGGTHELENLLTLCSRHHRFVHEEGCVSPAEDGGVDFQDGWGELVLEGAF